MIVAAIIHGGRRDGCITCCIQIDSNILTYGRWRRLIHKIQGEGSHTGIAAFVFHGNIYRDGAANAKDLGTYRRCLRECHTTAFIHQNIS